MIDIVIGNIVALIASILMVYTGFIEKKKKIIYIQIIQAGLFVASNLILNGITGAIISIIGCIRSILCYKNKLGLKEKIILTIISVVFSLTLNNNGIIGLLPMASTIVYMWLMNVKDEVKFKYLNIFTTTMWLIYGLSINSYTSSGFNIATIIANFITISKMKRNNKKKKKIV